MNIVEHAGDLSRPRFTLQVLASLLPLSLFLTSWPQSVLAYQDTPATTPAATSQPAYTQQTPDELQRLVAPIALYPDSLVAQVLAASTFPEQIVEADRWIQANPNLQDSGLAQAVDQQPWDPSVKALAAFPSVLGNMDKNLSWTSSLGDAYYNQQQDVMAAVQVMRQRAQAAGNLQTTPQQTVATQDSSIVIQPASPDIVYVPAYDPWLIYGAPIVAWPDWYPYPGIWYDGPYLSFGIGFGIGFFGGFGWGWGHWGFDWRNRYPFYNHEPYHSGAPRFSTEATTTGPAASAACNPTWRGESTGTALQRAERSGAGLQQAGAGGPSPSADTAKRLAGTLNLAARAALAPVPSAATIMAAKREAFRHAEVPAWAAVTAALRATVVAGHGNPRVARCRAGRILNMERCHMRRAKLDIDKSRLDTSPAELAAFSILLAGCLPLMFHGSTTGQKTFHRPSKPATHWSRLCRVTTKRRCSMCWVPMRGQLSRREMRLRTPTAALTLCRGIGKCIDWCMNPMEPLRYISAPRTGPRRYRSCARPTRGISTPLRARRKFCIDELAETNYRPFAFARNWLPRNKNIATRSAASMPAKSSVMTGNTTVFIGKRARTSRESIGPLVASAVADLTPYRGYYFHMLTLQGTHAPGGAKSYVANGKMTEGFAFVAYPAEYRASGVMSFIVSGDGVVYEKDLGKGTHVLAKAMKKYDPDSTWRQAEEKAY